MMHPKHYVTLSNFMKETRNFQDFHEQKLFSTVSRV